MKKVNGYYRVSKKINGVQKYFYGKTQFEALEKLKRYTADAERDKTIFEPIALKWAVDYFPTLAPNSLKGYRPALKRAVAEFGKLPVADITPFMISAYIKEFSRGRALKTVKTQLLIINHIFRYAINYAGINMQNPARDIIIPKNLTKRKITAPSSADIKRVKDNVNAPFGLFAYMGLYTGLRRGELLGLTWDDIDLKKGVITVNKSLYHVANRPHVKTPKTSAGVRRVPVLEKLKPYLKRKRGILFTIDGGYMTETQFQKAWAEYIAVSGVTCTPHQLRHAFATMLFEADIAPADAKQILGHAQVQTTIDIYTDIRESREKAINKKIKYADIT